MKTSEQLRERAATIVTNVLTRHAKHNPYAKELLDNNELSSIGKIRNLSYSYFDVGDFMHWTTSGILKALGPAGQEFRMFILNKRADGGDLMRRTKRTAK